MKEIAPIELPVPSIALATQIAADSLAGEAIPIGEGWGVRAVRVLVDLRACAAALGRPLTVAERAALQFKNLPPKLGQMVMRYADYVEIGPSRPATRATIHMPGALGNFLKHEATIRNLTLAQFIAMTVELYFLFYGTADDATRDHVEGKFGDLTKWGKMESVLDMPVDARNGAPYSFPYTSSALVPKERWKVGK